jgi:ATP-dependent DNA helicase RecG
MITEAELTDLLADIESARIERTSSTSNTDKFAQAVCAFANDFPGTGKPGYLIVGVDDAGKPTGLAVTDELLRNLAGLRSDGNIQPLPAICVARFQLPQGEVAVVETMPSALPPVRYKGRVWIRVGARRAVATEHEETILMERRVSSALTFDALPCLDSTLTDLPEDRFVLSYLKQAVSEETIAENNRPLRHQLAGLRLFDLKNDCPTNAGILVLGDNPTRYLPGAYVQFVRFQGTDEATEVVDEKRAMGDLRTVLQTLDLLLDVHIRQWPVAVTAMREEARFDYPRVAVREFLVNAVMHRSYQSTSPVRLMWFADHLRVHSPGGLWGEARADNFPHQVAYRNPVIAEAIRVLGYANRFGMGVVRAQKALELNGNPPAEFTFDPSSVTIVVRQKGREEYRS